MTIFKLFHSIDIGFFTQLIWISIGFFLLFLEMCVYIAKVKLSTMFVFYFFAGWKVVECLMYFPIFSGETLRNTFLTLSTNGSPGVFHAGPMVQLLYRACLLPCSLLCTIPIYWASTDSVLSVYQEYGFFKYKSMGEVLVYCE